MKKSRQSQQFLSELQNTPVVSAVCTKLNLSRQTVYRWLKEDPDFKKQYDLFISHGQDNVSDLAESQIIKKIKEGDMRAIIYWLENNRKKYYKPKPVLRPDPTYQGVTQFNISLHNDKNDQQKFSGQIKPSDKKPS
jgi:hypothetical protein